MNETKKLEIDLRDLSAARGKTNLEVGIAVGFLHHVSKGAMPDLDGYCL